jgi:glycosyltransferase involved in cell wall biosynthesis
MADPGDPVSRILWVGNPPGIGSGYSGQAGLFIPRLQAMGHQVAVACNYGLQGMRLEAAGVTYYPSDNAWGNRTLGSYIDDFQPDRVVALCDAWVLRPEMWPDGVRVAVWAPVDHYPVPPAVLATLAHEKVQPVAMSRFGEQLMRDCGLDPLYLPHGVDTTLFNPRPDTKAAIRAELGIPADAFLVGMVAANSSLEDRKGFKQSLVAFSRFAKNRGDVWLYAHTNADPPAGAGLPLGEGVLAAGCPPDRVKFPPASLWHLGAPPALVSNLYQAFDVLLNPSMGEGFGIPILEAQACGVPVIASDHSAMSELTQSGWLVAGDPNYDWLQRSYWIWPFVDSIVAALESAYESRGDDDLREGAAMFARLYDADLIARDYWPAVLDKLGRPRETPSLATAALEERLSRVGA